MTQPKTNNIPAPLYAAAGAGELALRQLRKLPTAVTELANKAAAADFDLDKVRATASRNAAAVLAGAQSAQQRARAAYAGLVARGERVVGAGVLGAADTVNADIEVTRRTRPAAE